MNNRVLLVDDDLDIISAFQRNLRKHFVIKTAINGIEALEIIRDNPQFAVIVSDYNMPKMTGIELLSAVRKVSPDTVRVMLTGYADLDTSMTAVNEGAVFRFLTKPINTDILITTIQDCIEQHRLVTSEKELLDKTLKGTIKILVDILSVVKPVAFYQASQIRVIARNIGMEMQQKNLWEIEIAALLSQIGWVAIPEHIIEKVERDEPLLEDEFKIFENHPDFAESIVRNIPRFEKISTALKYQNLNFDGSNGKENTIRGENIPLISRILKVAIDYYRLFDKGKSPLEAIKTMKLNGMHYDSAALTALMIVNKMLPSRGLVIKSVPFRQLRIGMILAEDIRDEDDYMLIAKGQEVTDVMLMRLINLSKVKTIIEPIRVYDTLVENKE